MNITAFFILILLAVLTMFTITNLDGTNTLLSNSSIDSGQLLTYGISILVLFVVLAFAVTRK